MYRYINYFKIKRAERAKFDNLSNSGMINQAHHEFTRFNSVNSLTINKQALWERWIRL